MKPAHAARTILDASLPLVNSHGFTRACLLEAVHTTKLPITNQTLDGLFPSSASHDGPTSALLRHWLQHQTTLTCQHLQQLEKPTIAQGLAHRLSLNENLKFRLRGAWSHRIFGIALPDLRAFTSHSALTTEAISRTVASTTQPQQTSSPSLSVPQRGRLSTIYAAAEWHQLSDASPDSTVTQHLLKHLLDRNDQVEGAVDEVALFGSHILKTWQGLAKSTYL